MPNGKTLAAMHRDTFEDVPKKYGERWLFFHRQDLHNGLREMAESTTNQMRPVKINLDCEIVSINTDKGTLRITDGTERQKDLLIVADGIRTRFQEVVIGHPSPVIQTGKSIYRCLVPIKACLEDPLTAPLFENQPPGLFGPNIKDHDTICGLYPIRQNSMLSIAYIHPTKPSERDKEDWNCPATLEDIEESISEFHPAIKEIPRKVRNPQGGVDITCYKLVVRKETETFVKGRTLLIGDAAHAMLTFHAQGAGMAIESAGALEVFFKDIHHANEVPSRLAQFNDFRHGRCVATQVMSNGMHAALKDPVLIGRIRKHYQGELPPENTKPWGEGFRDWFFKYDVFKEADDFLKSNSSVSSA